MANNLGACDGFDGIKKNADDTFMSRSLQLVQTLIS